MHQLTNGPFTVIHLRLVETAEGSCSIGHGNTFTSLADFLTQLDRKQLSLRHEVYSKPVSITLQFPMDYDPNETMVKKPIAVSTESIYELLT